MRQFLTTILLWALAGAGLAVFVYVMVTIGRK